MKGTAKAIANLKPMNGIGPIVSLWVGQYVYGTDAGTDITNFTHYYNSVGVRVELGSSPYKVSKANLTTSNEAEPVTPPIPPVDPPNPSDVKRIIDSVITWEDVSGVVHTTRMIPE